MEPMLGGHSDEAGHAGVCHSVEHLPSVPTLPELGRAHLAPSVAGVRLAPNGATRRVMDANLGLVEHAPS